MEGEDLDLVVVGVYLSQQVLDARLRQRDCVGEGGELVHGEVLLVHQLGSGDGWHPGQELLPQAVAATVLHWLQFADRGEELGGPLVSGGSESMQLLASLIVGEVRLLDYELLEGGVRLVLRNQVPWDASNNLERQVSDDYPIPVLLGRDSIHYERCLQLEKP